MQLVDEGKLDLDRDVNAYLDFKIPPRDGQTGDDAQPDDPHRRLRGNRPRTSSPTTRNMRMPLGAYLKRYTPKRIFAPGTTPAYSNWGTALAGYIVGRAAGMSFDDYIERRIFAPLGMANTSFRQPLPKHLQAACGARLFARIGRADAVRDSSCRRRPDRCRRRRPTWRAS